LMPDWPGTPEREADGRSPNEPGITLASSERMSPNLDMLVSKRP
jgi:hypothetical protein